MRRSALTLQRQQARATNTATIYLAAFSLVELLVCALRVGVLAALLLPAVTRSKSKAKEAQCVSNLKQIYVGFQMYPPDNSGGARLGSSGKKGFGPLQISSEERMAVTRTPRRRGFGPCFLTWAQARYFGAQQTWALSLPTRAAF